MAIILAAVCSGAFGHGDLHEQITNVSAQIASNSNSASLYAKRGELHRLHQDWVAAFKDFEKALQINPTIKAAHLSRARTLLDSGRIEEARAALSSFLDMNPEDVDAYLLRASAFTELSHHRKAASDYQSAISLSSAPTSEMYFARASSLAAAGPEHLDEALSTVEAAVDQLGSIALLKELELKLLLQKGDFQKAFDRVDHLLKNAPRKEEWLLRRGEIHLKMGSFNSAQVDFEQALAAIRLLPPRHRETRAMSRLADTIRERLAESTSAKSEFDHLP